jgi:outer membrane lipoprotein-sorting protein
MQRPLLIAVAATFLACAADPDPVLSKISAKYTALADQAYRVEIKTASTFRSPIAPTSRTERHRISISADRNSFRYEYRTEGGRTEIVSNGERTWRYNGFRNTYTESEADSAEGADARRVVLEAEKLLVSRFALLADV